MKRNIASWISALVLSCICLASIHFYSTFAFCLFMLGMPGAFAMILVTGVHGDFNAMGGIAYVVVNTVFFFYVLKLFSYLSKRFM